MMPNVTEVKLDNGVTISHVEGGDFLIRSPKDLSAIKSNVVKYNNGSFFYYKNDYISRVEDETLLKCLKFIHSDLIAKK